MIEFYKDSDAMAIRTDAVTDTEFLEGCAKALSEMIEQQAQAGDWEFSLGFWIPQIVDIACSLRGYKSEVVTRTVRSAGSSHFVASSAVAVLNDRKEVAVITGKGAIAPDVAKAKAGK